MFLKRVFCAGVCVCLVLPAWAAKASAPGSAPLSISVHATQNIDPSLQMFIKKVWQDSPTILGAQATLAAAQARVEAADKPLHNPSLELDTERTNINTTTIGLSQTLDWSDKQEALVDVANRELQAIQASLRQARQGIAVEALEAIARYTTTHEMRSLALRRSELMKEFIDAVKQKHAAGDVAALDVTLAQVAYSEALMAQAASDSELAEAEAALQAVSGLAMSQWPALPNELASPPELADPALLESLPNLVVLKSRMETARARIHVAKREGQIDPTLGLRAGREDTETLVGLTLAIPLFVRNNYKAQVRAASHEAVAEELAYRDAHRRAKARLDGSLSRFQNTSRAWQTWAANGQQAQREQMSLLEQMWQAGELTATDYLIQAKQNIDTQAAATALMGDVWQAAIAWLEASGQVEPWLGLAPAQAKNSGE